MNRYLLLSSVVIDIRPIHADLWVFFKRNSGNEIKPNIVLFAVPCVRVIRVPSKWKPHLAFDRCKRMISIGAGEAQVCAKWSDEPFGIALSTSFISVPYRRPSRFHTPRCSLEINELNIDAFSCIRISSSLRFRLSFFPLAFAHFRECRSHADCKVRRFSCAGWKLWQKKNNLWTLATTIEYIVFFSIRMFDGVTLL